MDVSPKPLDCSLSSQSEPEMAPLGASCSELACELPQEVLFESRTILFQVFEHPYLMGGRGLRLSLEMKVCVCVMWQLHSPTCLLTSKIKHHFFSNFY